MSNLAVVHFCDSYPNNLTVGVLYGAGAETLILVIGTLGNICPPGRKTKTAVYTQKPKKNRGLGENLGVR